MVSTLAKELGIDIHKSDELADVISSFFPRGSHAMGSNYVDRKTDSGELAVRVIYDGSGVADIIEGSALSASLRKELYQYVEEAFGDSGERVARAFLFSLDRVTGTWRSGDRFQILPVPPEAPDAEESYAAHPFVLEYPYKATPNAWLKLFRLEKSAHQLKLLLNLFLNGSITWKSTSVRKHWVFQPVSHDRAVWAQEGFFIPDYPMDLAEFSNISEFSNMKRKDNGDYFRLRGTSGGPLALPDCIDVLFARFEGLGSDRKRQFLRSCHWRWFAAMAWPDSRSAHYTSLISAIEALVEIPQGSPKCPCCKRQNSPGPTKLFEEFLEKFAPGDQTKSQRREFYEIRSRILHGDRLLLSDLPWSWVGMQPNLIGESEKASEISQLVRIALINWLLAHESP
jgi:hypothetical protein